MIDTIIEALREIERTNAEMKSLPHEERANALYCQVLRLREQLEALEGKLAGDEGA